MAQNPLEHTVYVDSEAGTQSLGAHLARLLHVGDVISLNGPLGAGKTRFVGGLSSELGVSQDQVTSPTFTLIQEYPAQPPLAHLDAYRLADSDEFLNLGVSELWEDGIVIVEWGEKVSDALPSSTLTVTAEVTGDTDRQWTFQAGAPWNDRWPSIRSLAG